MKRYEWVFPVAPERLRLQVRQVTHEVRQDRLFAIRGALLERSPSTESSLGGCSSDIGPKNSLKISCRSTDNVTREDSGLMTKIGSETEAKFLPQEHCDG